MTKKYDVAVIGAGPGGYVAAIKAAQRCSSVALIEKKYLGGSCLNCGCIPTKTLLSGAEVYSLVQKSQEFGVFAKDVSFDYSAMKTRKDSVVTNIRKSLEGLIKSNRIEILSGEAKFVDKTTLKIVQDGQYSTIEADKIIIATGSEPMQVAKFPCDHKKILDSTSILELTEVPKSLLVVGGGYIGCEFASLFAELGCQVTIVEALDSLVQAQGATISRELTKILDKKGIQIFTKTMLQSLEIKGDLVEAKLSDDRVLSAEKVLISIGRKVVSDNLNLNALGLEMNDKGMIAVNDKMETSIPGIYAIGDVTGIAMLAHVASHQGIVAASNATNLPAKIHYHAIPAVIFTHPEIAMVGLTEEQAKAKGYDIVVGNFPMRALGKAAASNTLEGFAQIIADKRTHAILGAQVIGHEASILIAEAALAIQNELTLECMQDTIHAHPTLAESWMEAAFMATDTPIHFPPKIKK